MHLFNGNCTATPELLVVVICFPSPSPLIPSGVVFLSKLISSS